MVSNSFWPSWLLNPYARHNPPTGKPESMGPAAYFWVLEGRGTFLHMSGKGAHGGTLRASRTHTHPGECWCGHTNTPLHAQE